MLKNLNRKLIEQSRDFKKEKLDHQNEVELEVEELSRLKNHNQNMLT